MSLSERVREKLRWVLLAFLLVVALTGGGSRADIESLPFLRFLSAVLVALAILLVRKEELSRIRVPLALLGAIAAVALLQLIPLPPSLWSSLPGRENIARIDALLELDSWRPLTLSPVATINALGSLTVPLAALLLFGMVKDRSLILLGIVSIGLASALFGILQLFADPRSGLFLYEITNNGSAVGFFANRNHHAVFLACCALIGLFLMRHVEVDRYPWIRPAMAVSVLFLGLAIVTNASRAGLIALVIALLLGALEASIVKPRRKGRSDRESRSRYLPIGLSAVGTLLLILFVVAERSPALARILQNSALEDLRAKLLPILIEMARDFQPWGAGLGAFEHAYRMREPVELLQPAYVNEAHNDWLQFPIEAGLPGLAILLVVAVYLGIRSTKLIRSPATYAGAILGLGIIVVIGAASVVDYPLRVPSMMVLAVIALAIFAEPAVEAKVPEGLF